LPGEDRESVGAELLGELTRAPPLAPAERLRVGRLTGRPPAIANDLDLFTPGEMAVERDGQTLGWDGNVAPEDEEVSQHTHIACHRTPGRRIARPEVWTHR
jgi:hypothetical protein